MLAQYILQHPVKRTRSGFWNTWAHTAQREISSVQRKLRHFYSHVTHKRSFFPYSRHTIHRKKEFQSQMQSYLGVEIPRTVKRPEPIMEGSSTTGNRQHPRVSNI